MAVDIAADTACTLGEGPAWDPAARRFTWLDVDARLLHILGADGTHTTEALDRRTTLALPTTDGGLVTAGGFEVRVTSATGGDGRPLAVLPHAGDSGSNDGAIDPSGALWVGTVDRSGAAGGAVFRVAPDGTVDRVRSGVALSNGIDWSPDERRVYHVDSLAGRVDVASVDDEGRPLGWAPFASVDTVPDGLCVDSDGCVWLALWNGNAVHRYTPDGRLDRVVAVPGGHVTSCAFGGDDLTTLFVTSATTGLDDVALAEFPHAGALFSFTAPVAGRAQTAFGTTP